MARHLQITLDDASWLKVLARETRGDEGYFGSKLHGLNRRYAQFMTRTLADGIARGELRADLDPQLARDFFFGGLEHWVRNTVGRGKPADPAHSAREIVRMLLDGWARRSVGAARGDPLAGPGNAHRPARRQPAAGSAARAHEGAQRRQAGDVTT